MMKKKLDTEVTNLSPSRTTLYLLVLIQMGKNDTHSEIVAIIFDSFEENHIEKEHNDLAITYLLSLFACSLV